MGKFILTIILLANQIIIAQPVTQEWVKGYQSPAPYTQFQVSIGGTGTDVAHSIIQTTDDGYALAGYTWQGGFYAYIAKLDASGLLQWTRTFGGTDDDNINSIIQTIDGGYIAVGSSVFKLDKNGTLQWCENISGEGGSIIQTSDNGYAIAGKTDSFGAGGYDIFIVKLNNSGALEWAKTFGGTGWDYATSIIGTLDGGYAICSNTSFSGQNLFSVIKIDSTGSLKWVRNFLGQDANSIIQTRDGGYAVVGRSPPIPYKFYIIKLDRFGAIQWTCTVWLRDINIAKSIIQTSDGGYVAVGFTNYVEGFPDWYIVMLDSTGTLEWSKVVTGGTGTGNEAFSIIHTINDGYAVAGFKDSFEPADDMYIVKYDSSWNTCGNNDSIVISQSGTLDSIISITPMVTSPTGFISPRTPTIGSGGTATMICVTGIQSISNEVPVSFRLFQNYPNPFNPTTRIKFDIPPLSSVGEGPGVRMEVYDVLGREIAVLVNEQLTPGTYEIGWDGTNYPSGVYFYRLESGAFAETKKMVLIK